MSDRARPEDPPALVVGDEVSGGRQLQRGISQRGVARAGGPLRARRQVVA
jgi:hypothetical protein